MPNWKKVIVSGSNAALNSVNVTGGLIVTGSSNFSGSNTLIGNQTITGSLNISGSTTQIGNNTLLGYTTLSGSIIISGSTGPGASTASVQIYGDIRQSGYHRFDPVTTNIDTSISASYIFVSGSTNDLYFSQNSAGYSNVTRLRWIEGNLYTGLLNGGVITTQSSTVYQISSGSGIIVDLNASLNDDPYPTIQYLTWGNLSASIAPLTASYQQAFVSIDSTGNIYQQGTPFVAGQFDTEINIGVVLFQNQSTINGVKTQPSTAYGFEQNQNIFNRAFGPLKLSGFTLVPSGSSTGSLVVGSGTAYSPGSNYTVDPNNPSYASDSGTSVSKIFRYYQSGSSWVYLTNGGAGFQTIDPTQYSNNGVLTAVPSPVTLNWTIQRVFWFPNSVAKAIVVYYGNNYYGSEAEAIANINIEPFVEAPNTAANAIYLGAIVISGDGVFTDADDFTIVPGGLFRSVGGSGGGGSVVTTRLVDLSDVLISGPTNGQPLVYNSTSTKWENSSTLTANLTGNASTSTTASYALTASYVLQAVSASFASTSSNVQGGTTNYISVWKTATSLSSSALYQDPNNNNYIGVFTTVPTYSFDINGTVRSQNDFRALTKVYFPGLVNTPQTNVVVWDTAQGELFYQSTSSLLVNTASYALTASSATIFNISSSLYSAQGATAGIGTTVVASISTGSYKAGFFDYTVYNTGNARAGTVASAWNNSTVVYSDTSTTDIGSTNSVTMSVALNGGNVELRTTAGTTWTVKTTYRLI